MKKEHKKLTSGHNIIELRIINNLYRGINTQ